MGQSEASTAGLRYDGGAWCCSCGVWKNENNGMERCSVSHARMQAMGGHLEGLSHLWAYGVHDRALSVWSKDANVRARLQAANG
jgi:hypothetical protein